MGVSVAVIQSVIAISFSMYFVMYEFHMQIGYTSSIH